MNGRNLAQYRELRLIAYGHYRNDLLRFANHLTIVAIGAISMIIPNSGNETAHYDPAAVIVTVGFFTLSLLLTIASALDRRQREVLENSEKDATSG